MQTIQIQTTQNVGIQYSAAGLGDRILAYLIDGLIATVYLIIVYWLLNLMGINSIWIYSFLYLPVFFYHLISEVVMDGQSIGKKQFNLKVVRLDGSPVTLGNYVMRWMFRLIDLSLSSGAIAIISIAVSKDAQRLGDLAAGTTVIKQQQKINYQTRDIVANLQDDYIPQFEEARNLSTSDIKLIRQTLAAYKATGNVKPVLALTEKVKQHLNIEADLVPVVLLNTVIKDYSYYTSR